MIKKVAVTGKAPANGITFFETETGNPTTLKTVEYSVTPGTLLPITSVTVTLPDLTTATIAIGAGGTNEATVSTILKAELMKIGYNFTEDFGLEPSLPSLKISGQTLTIISELVFTSINSGGSVSFTAKPTRLGKATFTKLTGSTTNPTVLNVNGTNRSDAHAWTYGATSTATVKGYIETALATEISAGTVLSVAVADTGTQYSVTIVALTGTTVLLNGVSFTQSNPVPYFKA